MSLIFTIKIKHAFIFLKYERIKCLFQLGFNQDISGWCVQSNFSSEPSGFKNNANNTWVNDASKQPDWDGADGTGANCN
jgi:hypothetical protein